MSNSIIPNKNNFPFFAEHPEIVYFDNAATTQKPQCVLDTIMSFYRAQNVNAGRGAYKLSTTVEKKIEEVRKNVTTFIGADKQHETFFTTGATGSQQQIAQACLDIFQNGDEILYSPYDHQGFVQPWIRVQKQLAQLGKHIRLIPYNIQDTGEPDIKDILEKVNTKTRLINITHIHNIFGNVAAIDALAPAREKGVIVNVDAAQSVGHISVKVNKLGADILTFSGHKMFAPLGTGVLYVRQSLQEKYNLPIWSEEGTRDYAAILGLGTAISYIQNIGIESIHLHLSQLTNYAITHLRQIPSVKFCKGVAHGSNIDGYGIVSFKIHGLTSIDVSFILEQHGILVRAGDHCTMTPSDETDTVRVSMHIYNTKQEIDGLIEKLQKI